MHSTSAINADGRPHRDPAGPATPAVRLVSPRTSGPVPSSSRATTDPESAAHAAHRRPGRLKAVMVSSTQADPTAAALLGVGRTSRPATEDDHAMARWLRSLTSSWVVAPPRLVDGLRGQCHQATSHHRLYYTVSGVGHAEVDGEHITAEEGSLLWILPGIPARVLSQASRRTLLYGLHLAQSSGTDLIAGASMQAHGVWEAQTLFEQLRLELIRGHDHGHREERVRGLLTLLFTSVLRAAEQSDFSGTLSLPARQAVTDFADSNIRQRPRATDLAEAAGLTPDYFTRVFRRTFGMPPREWLLHRRIRHATLALDGTDQSVTQIAHDFGYQDPFLFSRQFKSVMGVSPQAYRKRGERRDWPET